MLETELLGILIHFHIRRFPSRFRHLSAFLEEEHERLRYSFLFETALPHELRDVLLEIQQRRILLEVQVAFGHRIEFGIYKEAAGTAGRNHEQFLSENINRTPRHGHAVWSDAGVDGAGVGAVKTIAEYGCFLGRLLVF